MGMFRAWRMEIERVVGAAGRPADKTAARLPLVLSAAASSTEETQDSCSVDLRELIKLDTRQ